MGSYRNCPSCTNVNKGDRVYRCKNKKCGHIFCASCKGDNLGTTAKNLVKIATLYGAVLMSAKCPRCGTECNAHVGIGMIGT